MSAGDHPLRRHSREAVGAFVLLSAALFGFAVSEGERMQEWLDPGITLKVLMPPEGLYGLSAGADVEILGTRAGKVSDIVIDPGQTMHALVTVERQVEPFLRQDSRAFIKRRFGVAGDAYLEITRGSGAPLDLDYAVLEASGERIPTQTVEQLIGEVRERLLPILDQAERAIAAIARVATAVSAAEDDVLAFTVNLNAISGRIERGEGSIGRLLADERLADELASVVQRTDSAMARLAPILDEMQAVARNAALMSARMGEQSSRIPEITERAAAVLDSLQAVMRDVERTTPELPRLTRSVADSTGELPVLLLQSQRTLAELETLLRQLQASWLLGGGGAPTVPATRRVPALDIRP